ncbi:SpoIIE family protein phosphatase [Paenibacillus sp. FSL R5-0912]|uniref:SpoIIE family protein phosphatase n=1 Tax=Paenibacillus sp. FSL R5-0912 TaxID=1536771 RepID=UPI0006942528|nr:SpoIIE family protein phosphatase [Paenibacillus sp. FSL R5-0912]
MNNRWLYRLREWSVKNRFFLILVIIVILNLYNFFFVDKVFSYEFRVSLVTQFFILTSLIILHSQYDRSTKKLRDSEQRYESLFLYNNAGIYVVDLKGSIISVSPNLLNNLGYSEAEIKNTPFIHLFLPEDVPLIQQTFQNITNGSILSTSRKLQLINKSGETHIFDLSSVALMADGEIQGVIGFAKDITEFERMQEKLGVVQTQLNNIMRSIDIILWSYDVTQDKLLTISPASEKVFGYTPEEYYQYPYLWSAQVYEKDKDMVGARIAAAAAGETFQKNLEYRIVHSSGETRWVESRLFPFYATKNDSVIMNGVILDITHKKLIEQSIRIDLDLARQVQKSVLSQPIYTQSFAIDARYVPSQNLGGDMYAWYRITEHRYGILIMDVMGHGVSSALICMSIRSLLRGIIQTSTSPEEVIEDLNNHMNKLFSESMTAANFYFTAIYLIVDTETSSIEYINAGHPSGLLIDSSGQVFHLKSSCLPIGLIPRLNVKKQTIQYTGKSRILLYTDGLIERPGQMLKEQINLIINEMKQTISEPIAGVLDKLLVSGNDSSLAGSDELDDVCLIYMEIGSETGSNPGSHALAQA